MSDTQLTGNNYQIIRNRLNQSVQNLLSDLSSLDTKRQEVFGSYQMDLVGNERVSTQSNTIAWDLLALSQNEFLFGYNVQLGLKKKIHVKDVFNCYEFKDGVFVEKEFKFLSDKTFKEEFDNLYKYYKNTQFVKFHRSGAHFYMVFRIGKSVDDVKAFKWLIGEDKITFIDARSEHEYQFPDQFDFEWKKTTREQHVYGAHPHVSLDDQVFVETVGGDLTVKVDNNTETGKGIYAEPVDQADQTLDDADVYYANLGNLIVFKIRPYQEKEFRHFVFNVKVQEVRRIDALKDACVRLPEEQGIIFNTGYYLQNGEYKLFDNELEHMFFRDKLASSNGEDFLYTFYEKRTGAYLLVIYNIIQQTIQTPIFCHGYTHFDDGTMFLFKSDDEPKKHHAFQIWQTPFLSDENQHKNIKSSDSILEKLGNKEVVRAMAEIKEVIALTDKEDSYEGLYVDIYKKCNDILDTYHWVGNDEFDQLSDNISLVRDTSKSAIDEFDKIVRQRKVAKEAIQSTEQKLIDLKKSFSRSSTKDLQLYISTLGEVRRLKGEIIALKDLPLIEQSDIDRLKEEVDNYGDELSEKTIDFLTQDNALVGYIERIDTHKAAFGDINKVVECNELEEEISDTSGQLETLIDIVSNLEIEDSTKTTAILDEISGLYSVLNTLLADVRKKRKQLRSVEGKSEFKAQLNLLSQSLLNFIDLADTIKKCEEYLAKLLVQLEELEGKFSDFEEFIEEIETKREDIYNAFETKKSQLKEALDKRIDNLNSSGNRVLSAAENRLKKFTTEEDINAFIASDVMIEKLRRSIDQLKELGDSVKAESLESKLISLHEDALRNLRDKNELFEDGQDIIKFGDFQFLVNTQELLPSLILRNDQWMLHLTGSDFYEEVEVEEMYAYKDVWSQNLVSENRVLYRAAYLAMDIYSGASATQLDELYALTSTELDEFVSTELNSRLDEGYTRGVHDKDASQILKEVLNIHFTAEDLKYNPKTRISAQWLWNNVLDKESQSVYEKRLKGAGLLLSVFKDTQEFDGVKEDLLTELNTLPQFFDLNKEDLIEVRDYLFSVVANNRSFVNSIESVDLNNEFVQFLKSKSLIKEFELGIHNDSVSFEDRFLLCWSWLKEYVKHQNTSEAYSIEVAYQLVMKINVAQAIGNSKTSVVLSELKGTHDSFEKEFDLDFHHISENYRQFKSKDQVEYIRFTELKKDLLHQFKEDFKLDSFKPRVMSSFVRNRLIDNVYLPLIGANLTKQLGGAGENKRTDLMGLLLLISPPGYGKTTLMEYVASRLGLTFMKINGPSIGHNVTSIDPQAAPDATSREELEKLNFSFELGDNVMIYLDDIQHCNPEFLQKFISLCDAQRKIEGVYKGKTKTYDFRGKKVAVVMAGNPYTESGDKFQIPDMLANRADIYNLGDVIGDSLEDFKMSYLENSISSNKSISFLKNKPKEDLYKIIQSAKRGQDLVEGLTSNISNDQISDSLNVIKHLLAVQEVILKVNENYILSAGISEAYRTEPAFKLQGSYRNMNKITEKIAPLMTPKEVNVIINSHYENECQTLTSDAEANLLKYYELTNQLTQENQERWEDIKTVFKKNNDLKSAGGDQIGAAIVQLQNLNETISGIATKPSSSGTNSDVPPVGIDLSALKVVGDQIEKLVQQQAEAFKSVQQQPAQVEVKTDIDKESLVSEVLSKLKKEEEQRQSQQKELIENSKQESLQKLGDLRQKYPLTLLDKKVINDAGKDYIEFKFSIANKTEVDLSVFMGELEIQDKYGDRIYVMNMTIDEDVKGGTDKSFKIQTLYNKFLDQDILLNNLGADELVLVWNVSKVV